MACRNSFWFMNLKCNKRQLTRPKRSDGGGDRKEALFVGRVIRIISESSQPTTSKINTCNIPRTYVKKTGEPHGHTNAKYPRVTD